MARLDVELVSRGLAPSRTSAQRLIAAGNVVVEGVKGARPSTPVGPDTPVRVTSPERYVSRAAHKLADALDALAATPLGAPDLSGRRVLDAGASTGGFTQVALERGAEHVVAVDVGQGQLVEQLREDPRVTVLEHTNVRHLDPAAVAPAPQVLLADLSFISLTLVLEPLAAVLAPDAEAVVLVKPQFEVGPQLARGGVVTDDDARAHAVARVLDAAARVGLDVQALVPSSVSGLHGNREILAWLRRSTGSPNQPEMAAGHGSPPPLGAGPAGDAQRLRLARAAADGHLVLAGAERSSDVAEWGAW